MIKRILIACLILCCQYPVLAQSFDVEEAKGLFGKGNPLKFNGGLSLNSVLYEGNDAGSRDPFTYYLNGNVNLNICNLVNLPVSFSLTNSGSSYQLPSTPNRLSIHPTYKWITGHIGDVSMTFSPYTLNGHQLSGAGVELTPGSDWEFGAMYGRFQKAVPYDVTNPGYLPTYKRMGYGAKAGWKKEKIGTSLNFFAAKDEPESLAFPPDSMEVMPMQNLAGSLTIFVKPFDFIEVNAEYGLSLLTTDIRAQKEDKSGPLGLWPQSRMSSTSYDAIRVAVDYVQNGSRIGLGYERIDPGYRTLGAYYFTNDLENFTLNYSQSLWQNKLNVGFNFGYQHDNLANDKMNATNRWVGAVNANATFSERFSLNASYSNFQTYTNIRSDFEKINQVNTLDKLDTLDFVQLSQSAMLGVNLVTRKTETQLHNLNCNVSYQDAADKQGDAYRPGSVSELINASSIYNWSFIKTGLSFNAAVNCSSSSARNESMFTWGPTLGASAKLFKKKVGISGALSYNTSELAGVKQSDVYLVRFNASYSPYKRHNIMMAYNYQWRSVLLRESTYSSIGTIGYSYSF